MERNWDTIRELLLTTEFLKPEAALALSSFDSARAHEVSYHVILLEEAGLIHTSISQTMGGVRDNPMFIVLLGKAMNF